jgi:hypothetical protein
MALFLPPRNLVVQSQLVISNSPVLEYIGNVYFQSYLNTVEVVFPHPRDSRQT